MMAKLIKADGAEQEVQPKVGEVFTLLELQRFVGGYIELLDLGESVMVLNEEGKVYDLPCNEVATRIARPFLFSFDRGIRGDVVVCSPKEAGY
jgi:hypothetical protein